MPEKYTWHLNEDTLLDAQQVEDRVIRLMSNPVISSRTRFYRSKPILPVFYSGNPALRSNRRRTARAIEEQPGPTLYPRLFNKRCVADHPCLEDCPVDKTGSRPNGTGSETGMGCQERGTKTARGSQCPPRSRTKLRPAARPAGQRQPAPPRQLPDVN